MYRHRCHGTRGDWVTATHEAISGKHARLWGIAEFPVLRSAVLVRHAPSIAVRRWGFSVGETSVSETDFRVARRPRNIRPGLRENRAHRRGLSSKTNPMHRWSAQIESTRVIPHSVRRISVGSVCSARSTAGIVATSAVSRMAHPGKAIMSVSVALTW